MRDIDHDYVESLRELVSKINAIFKGYEVEDVAGACMWVLASISSDHPEREARMANVPNTISRFWAVIDATKSGAPIRTLQ
jgi:hypothetical protein